MNEEILNIAAKAMKVSVEEAKKHYKTIDDISAYYFWNPVRGGISVIVGENREKLAATSSVSFDRHKAAFVAGKRN